MKSLLGYYGGKAGPVGGWIASQAFVIPHTIRVEPFGGMFSVSMQLPPAKVEVYNDLSGELVNLFRMVRERPNDLREQLLATPYAREEFLKQPVHYFYDKRSCCYQLEPLQIADSENRHFLYV